MWDFLSKVMWVKMKKHYSSRRGWVVWRKIWNFELGQSLERHATSIAFRQRLRHFIAWSTLKRTAGKIRYVHHLGEHHRLQTIVSRTTLYQLTIHTKDFSYKTYFRTVLDNPYKTNLREKSRQMILSSKEYYFERHVLKNTEPSPEEFVDIRQLSETCNFSDSNWEIN